MKINTRSWHYRLWKFTHSLNSAGAPRFTSLCAYVQRIIWLTVPTALAYALVFLSFNIGFVLSSAWCLFWGKGYPRYYWSWINGWENSPIKFEEGLPLGRFRLYPYRPILAGLGAWLLVWGFRNHPANTAAVVGIGLGFVLFVGVLWLIGKGLEPDSWKLAAAYLRAKKEKVCPVVEFEDPSSLPPPDLGYRRPFLRADGSTDYADDRAASGEGLDY